MTVEVAYSSLNYKDGLVLNGLGGLVKSYPHVPGIDYAGTVSYSTHPDFTRGDHVIGTGFRVGEVRWGLCTARFRSAETGSSPYPRTSAYTALCASAQQASLRQSPYAHSKNTDCIPIKARC